MNCIMSRGTPLGPLCEMFNKSQLQVEVWKLKKSIQKMHVVAWQHSLNKNRVAMKCVHRHINSAESRVSDCEWMIAELDRENHRLNVYILCEGLLVGIVALAVVIYVG
jgi:hypothetical protein